MFRPLSFGHLQYGENKNTNIIETWINHSTVQLFVHVLIIFILLFNIQMTAHRDILILKANKMHYFSNLFW